MNKPRAGNAPAAGSIHNLGDIIIDIAAVRVGPVMAFDHLLALFFAMGL
jgi:hypothetical protein